MGKPPEEIPPEFIQHCDDIREAARQESAKRAGADSDGLGEVEAVAWFAGMNESREHLEAAISNARSVDISWKAIAIALGEPADPKSLNRVRNRYLKS